MLARVCVPATLEQVEPLFQPLKDLLWRKRSRPRGRKLESERHRVQPAAEFRDCRRRLELSTGAEQDDCFRLGQGRCDRIFRSVMCRKSLMSATHPTQASKDQGRLAVLQCVQTDCERDDQPPVDISELWSELEDVAVAELPKHALVRPHLLVVAA